MTSPGSIPALAAGLSFSTERNERPGRLLEPERFGERLVHFLDRHADAPAGHFPVLDELGLHLGRDVDRNGERQALVAAGAAVDLRIDSDHFAVHVEERSAGIARVDRHVGLYERDVGAVGQRARLGADDAGGDGVVEAVGRADGHDPFADAHGIGIADLDHGQVGRIDLDDRDVGLRVGADDLRGEFALVGEP